MTNYPRGGSSYSNLFLSAAACFLMVWAAFVVPEGAIAQDEIPFRVERDRVIIPTSINGSDPLAVVLDTGMGLKGVYLFRREYEELMDASGRVQVQIPGAGTGAAPTALVVDEQSIRMGSQALEAQPVFIGQGERTQGWSFDGIIGMSLLAYHAVELDYDASVIRLHDLSWIPQDPGWTRIPVRMERGLPWFQIEVETEPGAVQTPEVYIDLASNENLELLVGGGRPFSAPEGAEEMYLGEGLSGEIRGWRGEVHRVRVGGYDLFQPPATWADAEARSPGEGNAGGIFGNGFVQHFNIVFQYAEPAIYLRPNRSYWERGERHTPPGWTPPEPGALGQGDVPAASKERPPEGASQNRTWEELASGPAPVRYTFGPEVRNWGEVARHLLSQHPPELREAGIGGTVHLWVLVDPEGSVRKAVIRQSSGKEALDEAALRAADKIRFFPALDGAKPVAAWFSVPLGFPSRGSPGPNTPSAASTP